MNLHQFRYVREAVRRGLNLTEAAKALHTSQPGVSKAILELEEELGVRIFQRHGKRLRRVTEPGTQVLASIERILQELENLRRIGEEYSRQESGTLSIATTHTQARYMLPAPIAALRQRYPAVRVALHQGNPEQVAQMLLDGAADIGLATESLEEHADLITLPCYDWQHVAVVPAGDSRARSNRPSCRAIFNSKRPFTESKPVSTLSSPPSCGFTRMVSYPAEVGTRPATYSCINVSGPPVQAWLSVPARLKSSHKVLVSLSTISL